MRTHIIEATNGERNWGKFLIGQFTDEWDRRSIVSPEIKGPLLRQIGWSPASSYTLVLDLQTGEGAVFLLSGHAKADLNKHRIWVCPMFEPFLEWLYAFTRQHDHWWTELPAHVDLPDAPFAMHGYRREGGDHA